MRLHSQVLGGAPVENEIGLVLSEGSKILQGSIDSRVMYVVLIRFMQNS